MTVLLEESENDTFASAGGKPKDPLSVLIGELNNPGVQAALRRADVSNPPPVFYRVMTAVLDESAPKSGPARDELERKWAAIAQALAIAGTDAFGNIPLGRALAEAGVAEMRLLRLLQAHGDPLHHAVRTVIHQLSSRGQRFRPGDVRRLIDTDGSPREEQVRRSIAQEYYRHEK